MDLPERCFVIGAGAVGSALAGEIALTGRTRAVLVGQSPHALAIARGGLSLSPVGHEPRQVRVEVLPPAEVPNLSPADLVLLTVKAVDLEKTAAWLKEKCGPATPVIALQNGLGIRELLADALNRPVDRGLVFFGANSPEPGQVRYYPGPVKLARSEAAGRLARLLQGSLIETRLFEDFAPVVWIKLAFNCVINPLSGLFGASLTELSAPELDPVKKLVLAEVRAVASAEGVDMPMDTALINKWLWSDNVPSLAADLARGRETEIEFINGAVVRTARRHGLAAPANETLAGLVRFLSRPERRSVGREG